MVDVSPSRWPGRSGTARSPRNAAFDGAAGPAIISRGQWDHGGVESCRPILSLRLTGYNAKELVGRNTRILHGTKTDLSLLHHGRPDHQSCGEGWLCRKDGSPFFAHWNFSPLDEKKPAGLLVGLYHDQSEVKRLRDALLQSGKLDTIGRLASGVAHDFNTLLSVINGYCEIMTRKIERVPEAKKIWRQFTARY